MIPNLRFSSKTFAVARPHVEISKPEVESRGRRDPWPVNFRLASRPSLLRSLGVGGNRLVMGWNTPDPRIGHECVRRRVSIVTDQNLRRLPHRVWDHRARRGRGWSVQRRPPYQGSPRPSTDPLRRAIRSAIHSNGKPVAIEVSPQSSSSPGQILGRCR